MPNRFPYLGSNDLNAPNGMWGWAKRLIDELNNSRLFAFGDISLMGHAGKALRVTLDESGYELGEEFVVTNHVTGFTEAATSGDHYRIVDGTFTVLLPSALSNNAKFTFKLINGAVTLDAAGTETIDGAATYVLSIAGEAVTLLPYNGNWVLV